MRLTWTLQGELGTLFCLHYYFDALVQGGSSFQRFHHSLCVQLDEDNEVGGAEMLIEIFTFLLVGWEIQLRCVQSNMGVRHQLTVEVPPKCLCLGLPVGVVPLRPKPRQGRVSRYKSCVEFKLV